MELTFNQWNIRVCHRQRVYGAQLKSGTGGAWNSIRYGKRQRQNAAPTLLPVPCVGEQCPEPLPQRISAEYLVRNRGLFESKASGVQYTFLTIYRGLYRRGHASDFRFQERITNPSKLLIGPSSITSCKCLKDEFGDTVIGWQWQEDTADFNILQHTIQVERTPAQILKSSKWVAEEGIY